MLRKEHGNEMALGLKFYQNDNANTSFQESRNGQKKQKNTPLI